MLHTAVGAVAYHMFQKRELLYVMLYCICHHRMDHAETNPLCMFPCSFPFLFFLSFFFFQTHCACSHVQVREKALKALKDRLIERANIIQVIAEPIVCTCVDGRWGHG